MSNGEVQVPDGWRDTQLSSIATIDPESLKQDTNPSYKFRYIDISSVSTGKINLPSSNIQFSQSPSRARRIVRNRDVLMATVRPNLQAFAHYEGDGKDIICSTGFAVIRAKENHDSRFIFNTILSDKITRQIENLIVGSNYPAINSSDVKNLNLLLPPLPEQIKIASILTSVDNVIEKTEAQISKLQDLKKGMMTELLTKGIGHTEFKDSPVGRIPVEWDVVTIGAIAQVKGGKRMPKGRSFSDRKTDYPYIRVSNFKNGSVSTCDIRYVLPEDQECIKRYTISKDDIYISIAGTIGLIGTIPLNLDGAQLTENAAKIVFKNDCKIDKYFIKYLLLSEMCQTQFLQEKGTGGGVPKLAIFRIEECEIVLPNIDEQKKIASILTAIDSNISSKQQKLSHTKALKKALMNDLLTGKKRVTV